MSAAEELLERLAAAPARTALLLDFDGTLTPIVADPTTSRLPAGLADVLAGLAGRLARVAIISGRPVAFLAEQAAVPGVRLLGLYGLESWTDGTREVHPDAARWQDAVDRARARLAEAAGSLPGVWVEDKGLSVAVHWRRAQDPDAAEAAVTGLADRLAADTGLHAEPGKLVAELRPPVAWDKGAAVEALLAELDAGLDAATVAYIGDDRGDLPAFRAVRAAGGVAVAVDHGPETPEQVRAAADLVLDGPEAVADLLTRLHARLG